MKVSALVFLAAAADAGLIWPKLWPRQLGGLGRSLKVAKVTKLTPEIKPNAVHIVQQLGPITLKGVRQ